MRPQKKPPSSIPSSPVVRIQKAITRDDLRLRIEELFMDGMDEERIVNTVLRRTSADEAEIRTTLEEIQNEYSLRVAREGAAFVLMEMLKVYRRSQQRSYKIRRATDKAAKAMSIRTPDWVKIAQAEDRMQMDVLAKMSDLSQVLVENGMLKPKPKPLGDVEPGPRESTLSGLLAPAAQRAEELRMEAGMALNAEFLASLGKATYEGIENEGLYGEEEDDSGDS